MGLLGAAIPSIFKGVLGLGQFIGGLGMKVRRPQYNIPDEYAQNLGGRLNLLNARTPGASILERNILRSASNMQSALRRGALTSTDFLSGLSRVQQNANDGFERLALLEAQDTENRLAGVERARVLMGQQKEKAFQLNKYEPYMNRAAAKSGLVQGGLLNMFGASDDFATLSIFDYLNR